jgi:aerobic-type carbon monoxide dehydrogenase small subunit (CoxS/CutS family)
MQSIELNVNGERRSARADADRPLLDVLREDLELTGAKYGCGEGQCGACTVLIDGRPTRSCVTPAASVQGRAITTIEGIAPGPLELHPVQRAFVETGAMQCGYCVPGMIVETVALLERIPRPTREDINVEMHGHLCRCCGYPRLAAAIERAAELMAGEGAR